jgi:predicted peptidase
LNVIIACPDNSSSEITPSLSALITITIDSMKTMYNIDEDEVFLTGMSCNGKATLQFGLDKISLMGTKN